LSSDLVTVGRVGKPHGSTARSSSTAAAQSAERFAQGATLLVDGAAAEVVGSKRAAGGRFVIKLDRDAPRGATLSVRRDELPDPGEDTYYVFQLVGLAVEEDGGRPLGVVAEVENLPANDVLVLDSGLLLPLVDACVLDVDLAARRVLVARGFADDG
jgi:16S rRNA processing protein RimM